MDISSKKCIICDKKFLKPNTCSKKNWLARKYCSVSCQHQGLIVRPLYFNCLVCGKNSRRYSCQKNPKFCSHKCSSSSKKGISRPKFNDKWIRNLSKAHIGCQAKEKHP